MVIGREREIVCRYLQLTRGVPVFNTRAFYCSERIFIVTNPLLCYRI